MASTQTSSLDSNLKSPARLPIWKRLWAKTGLTLPMMMIIFKGAAAPVVSVALFQQNGFADIYTTLGYLVAIVSLLALPMQPRAQFFQTMIFNILGTCIGACFNLLTCYSAVQARLHTSAAQTTTSGGPSPGAATAQYNSSASAVAGIWLFFNIMCANAIRFKLPQLQIPVILYSININIAGVYAPQFPTMAAAESFVKRLLEAFLTGFAIATVINLVVFPVTSRRVVMGTMVGYLDALKGVLAAEKDYLQSMETGDLAAKGDGQEDAAVVGATKQLKAAIGGLQALHGKLGTNLAFAKREVAWGKLTAKDLDRMYKLLREILLPCLGLNSVADIFERVAEGHGWSETADGGELDKQLSAGGEQRVRMEKKEWNEVMKALHQPFQELVEAMQDGFTHASYALELKKRPKAKNIAESTRENGTQKDSSSEDIEAKAGAPSTPGDPEFGKALEDKIRAFSEKNTDALLDWCHKRGLTDTTPIRAADLHQAKQSLPKERDRRQLYLILYMEFLLWSTAEATLNLVEFADGKVQSGQMKRGKLILPGLKRIKKWIKSCFTAEDSPNEHTPDTTSEGFSNMNTGDSLRKRKDPEHLPPTNAWQRFGDTMRKLSHGMASQELSMGFRVACATMSIAIVAYLRQSQSFFLEQRIFWAQIMVAISMTMTSGSGIFGFIVRVLGTLAAACISLALWYIAGGRGIPGALLPILFLVYLPEMYGLLNYPRFLMFFMITMVTQLLILGYELEADKLGIKALQSNGQAYHPIYIFAWIRLATVAGGLGVAFFWTHFPYPITAKNTLRRRIGESIYLLASYNSCIHAAIGLRMENAGGDPSQKGTPAYQLQKARYKLSPKILAILTETRLHLGFTKFEVEIGGKFPREAYAQLINEVNNIFTYMSLIDYATARNNPGRPSTAIADESKDGSGPGPSNYSWLHDLARVRRSTNLTSGEITSILSLMSSAIINAQPLPPYLKPPRPYGLTMHIQEIDPDILSVRHVTEPGYAAFAVTQVASRLISDDMEKLLKNVKDLVGETDFSFRQSEEAIKMGDEAYKRGKRD